MSPIKIKLFVALHVLGALSIFSATLWMASQARQNAASSPRAGTPPAAATPAHPRPAAHSLPAGQAAFKSSADMPDWLRQAEIRELQRPAWPQ
ncbi:hypothetical protein [Roseateles sp.]|jgi:hypothetical protein|uniref:hypothetical protein n=1 Tax=Roseateles sp. TaxID=1971397 RepID=UPI0037C97FDE